MNEFNKSYVWKPVYVKHMYIPQIQKEGGKLSHTRNTNFHENPFGNYRLHAEVVFFFPFRTKQQKCPHCLPNFPVSSLLSAKKNTENRPRPPLLSITICDDTASCSSYTYNMGVIFDQSLYMVLHVTSVCKSAFFYLHDIGMIRKYLTLEAAQHLIHAFVTLTLDHDNSLIPNFHLKRLKNAKKSCCLPRFMVTKMCTYYTHTCRSSLASCTDYPLNSRLSLSLTNPVMIHQRY